MQGRVGHRLEESPVCTQCENGSTETVEHFLLGCAAYTEERDELRRAVEVGMRVDKLLGRRDFVAKTMKFVEKTGRFEF
jgi:hypothetical protein